MATEARARRSAAPSHYAVGAEAVAALSERLGEPGWLTQSRQEAWEAFAGAPPPRYERGVKGWWVTDLTALRFERMVALRDPRAGRRASRRPLVRQDLAARAVFRNSAATSLATLASMAEQGVVVRDLPTAVREHPEPVRRHLGSLVSTDEGKLTAMAAALWSNGLFVYVPSGVAVELPIQLDIALESPGLAQSWRTLVVAEPGSQVTLVEELTSARAGGGSVFSGIAEFVLGEGASLDYVSLERWGHGVSSLTSKHALVGRGARLRWFSAYLGNELSRSSTRVRLAGEGAQLDSAGLFFAGDRQHLDVHSRTVHEAPHTTANILLKGAVKDAAHAAFAGTIRVERAAVGADSYLGSHTLTMSDQARIDAVPSLEIEQNEVRVAHGSTAGRLDDEQLFYLMSRGLKRQEAVRTLLRGFFQPVLARLALPSVRVGAERALERKMSR